MSPTTWPSAVRHQAARSIVIRRLTPLPDTRWRRVWKGASSGVARSSSHMDCQSGQAPASLKSAMTADMEPGTVISARIRG